MKTNFEKRKSVSVIVCLILILPLFPNLFAALDVIHEIDDKQITCNTEDSNYHVASAMDSSDYIHLVFKNNLHTIAHKKINQDGVGIGDEKTISGRFNATCYPRLAVDSSDNVHVVWEAIYDDADRNRYVFYAKLSSSGTILVAPKRISQPNSRFPDISIDPNDYLHIVWRETIEDNIYYEWMNSSGVTLGNDIRISTAGTASHPQVAGSGNGMANIVWYDWRGTDTEIYFARFYRGVIRLGETRITTTPQISYNPSIQVDPFNNDHFHIVWTDDLIFYKKIDGFGSTIVDNKCIMRTNTTVELSRFKRFVVDENGDLHVIVVNPSGQPMFYYGKYDNDGNSLLPGPELISVPNPLGEDYVLSVTTTPNGGKAFIFFNDDVREDGYCRNDQLFMERLAFTQYGSVSGNVYDEAGAPLSGVHVVAKEARTENIIRQATSGLSGDYQIPNLPPGAYDITADADGYEPSTQENIIVNEGEDKLNIDFNLVYIANPGSVSGIVHKEGGEPLEGVEVKAYRAGTSILFSSDVTDPSGVYQITDLQASSYDVVASKNGYYSEFQNNIPVIGGQDTPNIDFILSINPGSISGRVTEIDGNTPITGAEVRIEEIEEVVYTDLQGKYLFSDLSSGNYTVKAKKDGYRSGIAENVPVYAGSETGNINFGLDRKVPPPQNLETRFDEFNNLIISWDAVTIDINGDPITIDYYSVYRSEIYGGPYKLLGTTPMNSFTDSDLIVGVRYYYVVTAHCAEWNLDSFYSKQISRIIGGTNLPPEAVIRTDINSGYAPLTVQFDASGSYDPEGDNLKYLWDFDAKDGIDIENPDSMNEKPSYEYKETRRYTVTLIVSDSKGSKDIEKMEIIVCEPPSIPYPSVSVDILQGTYYPGDNVEIVVSGNTGVDEYYLLEIVEYVKDKDNSEKYMEYKSCFYIGPSSFSYEIVLPALPVYNNSIHKVEANLYNLLWGFFSWGPPVASNYGEYHVEHNDVDMIILTNPEALRNEFQREDWTDILYLLQNVIIDDAIILYTHEDNPESIRDRILNARSEIDYFINYLFIIGGDDVIPYYVEHNSSKGKNKISDYLYWDFDLDELADINYSRLPTVSNYLSTKPSGVLNKYKREFANLMNYLIFHKILNNTQQTIEGGIVLSGRDNELLGAFVDHMLCWAFNHAVEILDSNSIEYMSYMPILGFGSVPCGLYEIIGVEGLLNGQAYDHDDMVNSQVDLISGHGNFESIGVLRKGNQDLVLAQIKLENDQPGLKYYFLNSTDIEVLNSRKQSSSYAASDLINLDELIEKKQSLEYSPELNNDLMVVFACNTTNIYNTDSSRNTPMSYIFMSRGALSYAGFGTSTDSKVGGEMYGTYIDHLFNLGNINLGQVYRHSERVARENLNDEWYLLNKDDVKYFIQLGYPKLRIAHSNRNSSFLTTESLERITQTAIGLLVRMAQYDPLNLQMTDPNPKVTYLLVEITEKMTTSIYDFLARFIQFEHRELQTASSSSESLFSSTDVVKESAPNTINFTIDDYSIDQEDSKCRISFAGNYNGESVESEDWILQGNPIIPYLHRVYDIPNGKTVQSVSFTTIQQNLGIYKLTEIPGTYFGELYEYYPLSYDMYMPEPVQWKIFKKSNGDMALVIDLFPFEYHTDTDEIIMHDNFIITISFTERRTSIDEVYMDKNLYTQGETVYLVISSTGASEIQVKINDENELAQNSGGYNVFPIETTNLMPGYHTISIKLLVGDALMDEVTTGFSLTDVLVEIGDPIVPESVRKGDALSIIIPLMNRGTSSATIDLQLTLLQEDHAEFIDLGTVSVGGDELKLHNVGINTNSLSLGELTLRIEGNSEFRTFRSNYSDTYIVEGETEGEGGTKPPVTINALALSRIRDAESLQEEVNILLEETKEKGLDTSTCELIIEEALNLLEEAKNFYAGGNYIAANYYALEAIKKFREAMKCLEDLLGK